MSTTISYNFSINPTSNGSDTPLVGDSTLYGQQFSEFMHVQQPISNSFVDFILSYLNDNSSRLRPETWSGYKSQISKMLKFKKQVSFVDVSEKFINDYRHYMLHVLHNNENTIGKSLRILRTFVNLAMRHKYIKHNPFEYISIKKVEGKRDFLSAEELNRLARLYLSGEITNLKERRVVQYFLFACYTGLRYSDLKALRSASIQDNHLRLNMHKTNCMVNIPLSKKALQLLPQKKENNNNESIFQVYCNRVTNRILHKVSVQHHFNKHLTCHVARHTFATVSIHLGIPIEVVSKFLGHTNLRTTQLYARIIDPVKDREMKKWDEV
jgi:site-specific recombinase XerC